MSDSSSDDEGSRRSKRGPKSVTDLQRETIKKLMTDPTQDVFNQEKDSKKDLPMDLKRALNPHEFVRNVMGASAGAGSGEFDIYRGCRNRELLRQEFIKKEAENEKAQKEFEEKRLAHIAEAEKRTAKKRAKRLKAKQKLKSKPKSKTINDDDNDTQSGQEDEQDEQEEIDLDEKVEAEN